MANPGMTSRLARVPHVILTPSFLITTGRLMSFSQSVAALGPSTITGSLQ